MITNNDDARWLFADKKLTYAKAFENLGLLRQELKAALKEYGDTGKSLNMTLRANIKGDKVTQAYIRVDGPYFKDRECISFNPDGFIGFAGWASSENTAPILKAFERWCEKISEVQE